jgi:hypothetical protein
MQVIFEDFYNDVFIELSTHVYILAKLEEVKEEKDVQFRRRERSTRRKVAYGYPI